MPRIPTKWNFINFIKWINQKEKRITNFLSMGSPIPFDVSLRDGIQSIPFEKQSEFTLNKKKEIFTNIMREYLPKHIEIGSIVSPSVLPIMKDSPELFKYGVKESAKYFRQPQLYMLIPNIKNLEKAMSINGLENFSFITSASNEFQMKNTRKNLLENKKEIFSMMDFLNNSHLVDKYNVKLYISCINECPISGKLENFQVAEEILKYHHSGVGKICLSDTCGSLDHGDFKEIMYRVNHYGMPLNQFSLHLHVNPARVDNVKKIMFSAFDFGITNFDVSELSTGGCSVTMKSQNICPNLSYDLYYETLAEYIEYKP